MKKILVLNGSPQKDDGTNIILRRLTEALNTSAPGAEADKFDLAAKKISIGHCGYCGKCKSISGGECIFNNAASVFIRKVFVADIVVIGTPVYSWGISSQLEIAVKKLFAEAVELQRRSRGLMLLTEDMEEHYKKTSAKLDGYFRFVSEHLRWNYLGCVPFPAVGGKSGDCESEILGKIAAVKEKLV